MGYSYTNKKGTKYFLHSRKSANGGGTLYFFSKEDKDTLKDLPDGYEVKEVEKTGLPVLKKKG